MMDMLDKTNMFRVLWSKGYKRLLPVVPYNDPMRAAGKRPGEKLASGKWLGGDSKSYEADEAKVEQWFAMGAGVGIRCDRDVIGIDIDVLDAAWSERIQEIALSTFGQGAIRIGRAPKALLVFRPGDRFNYRCISFDQGDYEKAGLVEMLAGESKWFVAEGVHPDTQKPYYWPNGLPNLKDLPSVSAEQVDEFFSKLAQTLPQNKQAGSGDRSEINQDSLKGDPSLVSMALRRLPNEVEDYFQWVRVAAAVKAATVDDPDTGLEAFVEWSDKLQGSQRKENAERVFNSLRPPYEIGADYIYESTDKATGSHFSALKWVDPPTEKESPPADQNLSKRLLRATPYAFPEPSSIPKRQEIYGQHYYRKFVSATVAPSGVGKSSLEIIEALAIASGKPLLGVTAREQARVWLWNGEDPRDELERRISAAMQHYGLAAHDIGDRLFVDTGREQEIILAVQGRDGAKISAPVVEAVLQTMRDNRIDVLQIDPFVSSHRITENDNGAIDMVTKQWAKIADVTKAAVELVHHVRKLNGGEITVEDSRGAGALLATSRSARALSRMTKMEGQRCGVGDAHRSFFRFGDAKNNLALVSEDTRWFKLASVQLGNGEGRDAFERASSGDSVGVVTLATIDEDVAGSAMVGADQTAAALSLVGSGEWKRDVRSGDAWIGVAIANAFELDLEDEEEKARVRQIVKKMLKDGLLKEDFRTDKNRNMRCYIVRGDIQVVENGAFE